MRVILHEEIVSAFAAGRLASANVGFATGATELFALLLMNSALWHHAASEILGDRRGQAQCCWLVIRLLQRRYMR
jgi:hypothetical protein